MDVAVHRSKHHFSFACATIVVQETFQVGDGFLHHFRRLEYEGQDEFA